MKLAVTVHLTDSGSIRGHLESPNEGGSGPQEAPLNLGELFTLKTEGGAAIPVRSSQCDLIEIEHPPSPIRRPGTARTQVAVMLANWQLVIGGIACAEAEAVDAIRALLLAPARFMELQGSRSRCLVNRDAVLWMVPFLPDAETGMFALSPGGFADPNAPRPDAETVPS